MALPHLCGCPLFGVGFLVDASDECPLGGLHRRHGGQRTFFELYLPPRLAQHAVPFLGSVSALGVVFAVGKAKQGLWPTAF